MNYFIHNVKFWKVGELEVFWSVFKEYGLQNQETERKLICSNAYYRSNVLLFLLSDNLTVKV
jgi:hypothetical protein